MWNLKNGTHEPICKAEVETQIWRAKIQTPRGKGPGGRNWEVEIDIYILLRLRIK